MCQPRASLLEPAKAERNGFERFDNNTRVVSRFIARAEDYHIDINEFAECSTQNQFEQSLSGGDILVFI